MSFVSSQKTWFNVPAYSWRLNKPVVKDIESGDKILLHTGILHALIQRFGDRPLPSPIIFEVEKIGTKATSQQRNNVTRSAKKISHVGVLEFSNVKSSAFLPDWMMRNLSLTDGDEIQLRLKELPVATSLILQPLRWDFGLIPTPKLALEFALRSFTCLTEGDTFTITIGGKPHSLIVKKLSPESRHPIGQPNACALIGSTHKQSTFGSARQTGASEAELAVEFEPPVEPEPEEEKAIELTLDAPVRGQADSGSYKYYRIKSTDSDASVQFDLTVLSGDPEFAISTKTNKPQLSTSDAQWQSVMSHNGNGNGNVAKHDNATFTLQHEPTLRRLTIHPTSKDFVTGWYYIGILAYGTASSFELCVRQVTPPPPTDPSIQPKGMSLSSSSTPSSSAPSDPTSKQCETCRAWVSAKAMSLHSIQCSRMNTYCEICQKPIRKSEMANHIHCDICAIVLDPSQLQKHVDLVHRPIECADCHDLIPPNQLSDHRENTCPYRLVHCKYCSMQIGSQLLADHQAACGSVTDPCSRCGKMVPRRQFDIHLAVEHRINLSLQPGDRNNMGLPPNQRMTQQQMLDYQRQAASFQHREKEVNPPNASADSTSHLNRPLTEEEQFQRAIAASLGQDPSQIPMSDEYDRAIAASIEQARHQQTNPNTNSRSTSTLASQPHTQSAASSIPSQFHQPSTAPLSPQHSDGHHQSSTSFNDDDDVDHQQHSEDEVIQTWDEDEEEDGNNYDDADDVPPPVASRGVGGEEMCPCGVGFRTFAELERHMADCAVMNE